MSSPNRVLDQTAQGLVNLAIAEYQSTMAEAERVAQAVLNDRLAPVREVYAVGGKLELDQDVNGDWFAVDNTPKPEPKPVKRGRRK